jgi:hypothetical protein
MHALPCYHCVRSGGAAQELGGDYDQEGRIGKNFTTDGAVGGTVQAAAKAAEETGDAMQRQEAQQHHDDQQPPEHTSGTSASGYT